MSFQIMGPNFMIDLSRHTDYGSDDGDLNKFIDAVTQ